MLTVFPGGKNNYPPTRIQDIKSLGLPDEFAEELKQAVHKDRMYWEPIIECADSYENIRKKLEKRGYGIIPMHCSPSHPFDGKNQQPVVETSFRKTMLQKKH